MSRVHTPTKKSCLNEEKESAGWNMLGYRVGTPLAGGSTGLRWYQVVVKLPGWRLEMKEKPSR